MSYALKLYNTLIRNKEEFKPLKKTVGLYTCGPTVYNYAHIGNLRTYIFEDILKRTLVSNGYKVKHVMNITDVGHLSSDADEGEDKIESGAKREKKTVWEIADFYTKTFKKNLKDLNISEPNTWCKATDHIKDQIKWIKKLCDKGYTYQTDQAIYFDTSKFKNYGKLSGQNLNDKKIGARNEVVTDSQKKNPQDFALWFFSTGHFKDHILKWPSPWGTGFPGWHLECSVMAQKYLGETIDIHCGGIDHIAIHHTNEIAQAEAVTGKPFVNYWLHGEFLVLSKDERMGKSKGNFITLQTLKDKNINPLAFRFFTLGAHYRSKLNFSWAALQASQKTYDNLYSIAGELGKPKAGCAEYEQKFFKAINDDLNTPQGLAVVWKMLKSNNPPAAKKSSLLKFDKILGLNLHLAKPIKIPGEIKKLAKQREEYRKKKEWQKADAIRLLSDSKGYIIEDTEEGTKIRKK